MDRCAYFFKALSNGTRRKILELLKRREMRVSDIVSHFNISQPTISHHLDILVQAGLVEARREGKEVYYRLDSCLMKNCCVDFFKNFDIKFSK